MASAGGLGELPHLSARRLRAAARPWRGRVDKQVMLARLLGLVVLIAGVDAGPARRPGPAEHDQHAAAPRRRRARR